MEQQKTLSKLEELALEGILNKDKDINLNQNSKGFSAYLSKGYHGNKVYESAKQVMQESPSVVSYVAEYLLGAEKSKERIYYGIELLISINEEPTNIAKKVIDTVIGEPKFSIINNYHEYDIINKYHEYLMPIKENINNKSEKVYQAINNEIIDLLTPYVIINGIKHFCKSEDLERGLIHRNFCIKGKTQIGPNGCNVSRYMGGDEFDIKGLRNAIIARKNKIDKKMLIFNEVLDDLKLGLGYELFDKKGYNKSYNFLYQSKEEKTTLCREIIKSIDNLKENDITKIKFLDHSYGG